MSNVRKPPYAHTPGSGRPSLAQQHETRQAFKAAQAAAQAAEKALKAALDAAKKAGTGAA